MRYGNFQFFKVAIHEMNIQKEPAHGNIEITDNVNGLKINLTSCDEEVKYENYDQQVAYLNSGIKWIWW